MIIMSKLKSRINELINISKKIKNFNFIKVDLVNSIL